MVSFVDETLASPLSEWSTPCIPTGARRSTCAQPSVGMSRNLQGTPHALPRTGTLLAAGLLVALLLPAGLSGQIGNTFSGVVVSVTDGDTVSVRRGSTTVRVRVDGIDTPETNQAFGPQARTFTSALVRNKRVTVDVRDIDRYGRLVGRIRIAETDLSVALLQEGLAWHYTRYSDDPTLADAETQARAAQIGLWSQATPVPPWDFRRGATPSQEDGSAEGPLHGNRRSRVFHRPGCRNYGCQNCTVIFQTPEDASAAGFRPAGDCHRSR